MMPMRTTLTIDDSIMKAARQRAAREGRPLKAVIGDALRLGLGLMQKSGAKPGRFKLTTVNGRGLQPGARLDDRDALFDLMDGR